MFAVARGSDLRTHPDSNAATSGSLWLTLLEKARSAWPSRRRGRYAVSDTGTLPRGFDPYGRFGVLEREHLI